jgi:MFS transporter, MHS family, shikimate and dehydroshikimate transport protein
MDRIDVDPLAELLRIDAADGTDGGVRQVLVASVVETVIEWYDFLVYSTAAALVFKDLSFQRATHS